MMDHNQLVSGLLERTQYFIPHGHCYLWIPSLLWLHVVSDFLIGAAYLGISLVLYALVRKIRLPFSPVFIAFGLFIGLCGLTHFMKIWTVWNPDYWVDGWIKAATAAASVATAIGLMYVRPQIEEVAHSARLSEERRIRLESTHAELESLYNRVKELSELKSQFFANVSHELRTPLALILGPTEQMLRDGNLTPEQQRQLEGVSRNGKSLLKQVNDLLDASKLEAGKMEVRYVRLDGAFWLRRIASQFEVLAEQRRIALHVAAPQSLIVEADPDMLERVIINLLSNAFKFTPDNGMVEILLESTAEEYAIQVSDSGPGIAYEQRETIFERFRQADGGATRRYGGTGLGLAIVRDFVLLHSGRIEVEESNFGGAQFTVHLPLRAASGQQVQQTADYAEAATQIVLDVALQELSAGRVPGQAIPSAVHRPELPDVLIVEDNPEMRDFIGSTLAGECNVISASDGQEGLERALATRPDLVITDIMMPRMSGDQLVKELRSRNEFNTMPILLLSAKADDDLRIALLQQGAQDYLHKPFLPQELEVRAANLIAAKRAGDTLRRSLSSSSRDLEALAKELDVRHMQLQVALETTRAAREQAEKANSVKAEFLAMVSHELRTPLSTIDMNVQLLSATHADSTESASPVQMALDRLSRATAQMSSLVEGLLQYTRIENSTPEIRREKIDAVQLLQEVVSAHIPGAPAGVEVSINVPKQTQASLVSDAHLLRIILSNLVSNAIKFTRKGTVTASVHSEGGRQVFKVHDTGIGIHEADLQRIFEPFAQLEPVWRKSLPGVGLGLSIARRLTESLGGKIEVSSKEGSGSVFTVSFPENWTDATWNDRDRQGADKGG